MRSIGKATGRTGAVAAVAATLVVGAAIDAGARQIVRGDRADRVTGTAMADRILLGGGNDFVRAGRGSDVVRAGAGRDRVFGGSGNDRVYGDSGSDRLYGERGNDRAYGGTGGDRASGGLGNDALYGQTGRDTLFGDSGSDRLSGGAGGDRLDGGAGADRMFGGAGDDAIEGRDSRGEAGIDGGAGRDVCTVDNADVAVTRDCEVIQAGSPPPPPPGGGTGGGGTGGGGTGGGGGATRPTPFSLTSQPQGTTCTRGSVCQAKFTGVGAKNGSVTVETDRPNVVGQFEATVAANGSWNVQGEYGCFDDGTITLKSGSEQIILTISCETDATGPEPPSGPPSGGPGNGPLAITSVTGTTTCASGPAPCGPFTISGTGADGGVVAVVEQPGVAPVMADQADDNGAWSVSPPGWGCREAGPATVTIRDSAGDLARTTLTCT